MSPLVRLGLRLAGGGGAHERARTGAVVAACAVGAWVLLNAVAIANAELDRTRMSTEDLRLLVAVMLVVTMPVTVLVATATRLSSSLRDRRLAGLRLLGLSPGATRMVAAVESGAAACLGTILGAAAFWLGRPVVSGLEVAGSDWSQEPFTPPLAAALVVVVGVPLAAVLVSLVPTRRLGRDVLAQSRVAQSRRPSPWRLLPVILGGILCLLATRSASEDVSDLRAYSFFAGAALCGIGLLLVVPVFVRLLADLMVRVPGRPTVRIAGRRLQSQPAVVARIVSGLLIGLFVVSGARSVVGAFEDTPQYIAAERAMFDGPAAYSVAVPGRIDLVTAVRTVEAAVGVRGVVVDRRVRSGCTRTTACEEAFVGTCAEVAMLVPEATGCRDDRAAWLGSGRGDTAAVFTWRSIRKGGPDPVRLAAPSPDSLIASEGDRYEVTDTLQASIFIPLDTPGVRGLAEHGKPALTALADPGRGAETAISEATAAWRPRNYVYPLFYTGDYQFVAGLRAMVWAVAAVVLSVGLLAFAIAAIDRAVSRRAEMVSLQLLGTPRRVIRAAQWWEALLPLALGLPGAVLLGWAVGSGYLLLGGALRASPWQSTLALGAIATAAAVLIAGLTVLASAPRVRADLIRRT